jgi:sialic acid synthase SpsE
MSQLTSGIKNKNDLFFIAEIGVNHEGSLERAFNMIDLAAEGGADAAKFQTYKAETLASKASSPAYWDLAKEPTPSQFELFSKLDSFGEREYFALAEKCAKVGIEFMSTPFDLESVDLLDPLVKRFKVASADLTNIPLLRKIASKNKPVIMSCGASTIEEIEKSLDTLIEFGARDVTLLHCVLNYPTPPENANISAIRKLQQNFGSEAEIGYSDHVAPNTDGTCPALELAVCFGARVIEKHFTDDRTARGNDHYHSIDADGLRNFRQRILSWRVLEGSGDLDLSNQSQAIMNARRRVFTKHAMDVGHTLLETDLIALRANEGITIDQWDHVVGKSLSERLEAGQAITESKLNL